MTTWLVLVEPLTSNQLVFRPVARLLVCACSLHRMILGPAQCELTTCHRERKFVGLMLMLLVAITAALKSAFTCADVSALVNRPAHTCPANCRPTPAGLLVYCGSLPIITSEVEPGVMPLVLTVPTLCHPTYRLHRACWCLWPEDSNPARKLPPLDASSHRCTHPLN